MNKQKDLWEKLARENTKYYINSDFGKTITDDQFKESGFLSYQKLIKNDGLVWTRDTILDFGCGNGRLSEFMAQDFKKVIVVDISPTMIAQAKERLKSLSNVEFFEIDGVHIPIPNNSIDFVFSYLVFQHIKERRMFEDAFSDIFRVLNIGGIFKTLLRCDLQKDMDKWWAGQPYNKDQIQTLCGKIGFKIIKIQDVDKNSYWLWAQK